MPDNIQVLDPTASEGGGFVGPTSGYSGSDPVLRNPEFARFIPPGFQGTRFQLPPDNQALLHQYVTEKADEDARNQQFIQNIQQSAKVEDAYKAVAAARKFMATRKLGNEYQAALAAGLPAPQAMASAMYNNAADLFDDPSKMAMAFEHMGTATMPAPPLGQVTILKDPLTGEPIGHGVRSSAKGLHVLPTPKTDVSTRHQIAMEKQAMLTSLQREYAPISLSTAKADQPRKLELEKKISELRADIFEDLKRSGAKPVPLSGKPLPQSKADLIDGETYNTSRGPAVWTSDHFEAVK